MKFVENKDVTIKFLKEFCTSIGAERVEKKWLHVAALVKLLVIFPSIFIFTFFSLLGLRGYGYHPQAEKILFIVWLFLAGIYIISNFAIVTFKLKTRWAKILTYIGVLMELGTNQLILYSTGSLVSHGTLYIIVIITATRIFFDYGFALFAAVTGGVLFSITALLEIYEIIPLSPNLPFPINHPIYSNPFAAFTVIRAVLIGILIALFSTNYGMNQAYKMRKRIQAQSLLDGLTGIANRKQFQETIEAEWKRGLRNAKPLSFIMVDIDSFKAYNDTYGHQAGDACLKQVAQTLSHAVERSSDLVARYGGEEFAILLPETPSQGAAALAENLRIQVENLKIPHSTSPVKNTLTISLGVATLTPSKTTSSVDLIEHADKSLYTAKHNGRNQVVVSGLDM